ncbi:FHA domain-containing protein [Halorhodospira sp. 9622]|uniref:FHA domain-containing protein n=1 Tax=Halorhodospira sp. 9622 TaxID=2899136 RepID=UPI00351D9DAB
MTFALSDFQCSPNGLILGRDEDYCDLVVDCKTVSKQHAALVLEEDVLCIEDLSSTNGTLVSGERLEPGFRYYIGSGCYIKLGGAELELTKI